MIPATASWDHLEARLRQLFNSPVLMKYEDVDGDIITMSSVPEWEECVRQYYAEVTEGVAPPPLRMHLIAQPSLKSGVTGAFFYTEKPDEQHTPDELEGKLRSVPTVLEKYLPAHPTLETIPGWLRPAIALKDGELDINVRQLATQLADHAVDLFDTDLHQAHAALKDACELSPSKAEYLYNLACAEARLGLVAEAYKHLRSAYHCGFDDHDHMLVDDDLANMRKTPQWDAFCAEFAKGDKSQSSPLTTEILAQHTKQTEEVQPQEQEEQQAEPRSPVLSIATSDTELIELEDAQPEPEIPTVTIPPPPPPPAPIAVTPVTVAAPAKVKSEQEQQAESLLLLGSMGFADKEQCLMALKACEGKVNLALDMLLAQTVITPRV